MADGGDCLLLGGEITCMASCSYNFYIHEMVYYYFEYLKTTGIRVSNFVQKNVINQQF